MIYKVLQKQIKFFCGISILIFDKSGLVFPIKLKFRIVWPKLVSVNFKVMAISSKVPCFGSKFL